MHLGYLSQKVSNNSTMDTYIPAWASFSFYKRKHPNLECTSCVTLYKIDHFNTTHVLTFGFSNALPVSCILLKYNTNALLAHASKLFTTPCVLMEIHFTPYFLEKLRN